MYSHGVGENVIVSLRLHCLDPAAADLVRVGVVTVDLSTSWRLS
jgi:hypothetical protein